MIGEIYNISAPEDCEFDVIEIAQIIVKLFGKDDYENHINFVDDRKFNDCRYYIDSTKLKQLGWSSMHTDFLGNIKELIKWYGEHKKRYNL
jgi:dTDP-D-glucose 4,6-dehydratase